MPELYIICGLPNSDVIATMCVHALYFYTLVIFENCIWFCHEFISLYHIFSMQYVRLFNTP